eukprot:comp23688_c1_seq1/m.40665 comp23688_c1_seq1/g.40665  ORF comp23688_c1_seq1/g.40665 comp23688_c1_seq1/m.40665 type:complete len:247 (-) comp23688_c1_seq1:893-1633(-)
MKMLAISLDDYREVYWPKLLQRLELILAREPGSRAASFSHEEAYRMVYNVCCQSHHRSLYSDLKNTVSLYLRQVAETVASTPDDQFLPCYAAYVEHYMACIDVLCPVFLYLERTYLQAKLQTSLHYELALLFRECVMGHPLLRSRLSVLMRTIADTSPWAELPGLDVAFRSMHALDPGFAQQYPILLARFLSSNNMAGAGVGSAGRWGLARQKREGEEMDMYDQGRNSKRALLDSQPHLGVSVIMD